MKEFGKIEDLDFDEVEDLSKIKLTKEQKTIKAEKLNYQKAKDRANAILVKNLKQHFFKIKNIEEILNPPKKNEQYRIKAIKSFNAMTFILYIIKYYKIIDKILITTYNMNEKTISTLFYLYDEGKIKQLFIIISESIRFRMPKRISQLKNEFNKRKKSGNINIALIWNHSKIATIKTSGQYFVIEGSGNYSDNAEIEQYLFENNKLMYDDHFNYFYKLAFTKEKSKRHIILK